MTGNTGFRRSPPPPTKTQPLVGFFNIILSLFPLYCIYSRSIYLTIDLYLFYINHLLEFEDDYRGADWDWW